MTSKARGSRKDQDKHKRKVGQIYKTAKGLKGAVPNQTHAIKDPEMPYFMTAGGNVMSAHTFLAFLGHF